ncbi:MAG: hypothetical protein QGH90_04080 [Candidatus Poseidoniaceae archaeon]|nr:hypothetical protein [Candidatus Poseidoniaceae archaeon]
MIMRLFRAIYLGIMAFAGGLLLGFIGYMIGGAPEGAGNWQNWQYLTCYAIPASSFIFGVWWGWNSGAEYASGSLE